ncbi:ABC transporter ATP-binding protein [Parasediminibacterium sp. JCM 36343]|uniref:ABC transporter ATP-binding protein n=1 Tax=Parasediminibacterium sp. JCM 36343 TaxID=3374279 RepID=UPI0039789180
MKILIKYLSPYRWQLALAMLLAAINQVFSLLDPTIFGKIIDFLNTSGTLSKKGFVTNTTITKDFFIKHIAVLMGMSIGVAMVSRIAKSFQDYVVNVVVQKFGAKVFTDGLKHSMRLPYQDFADQRSGETLSILQKVRQDSSQFIGYFINVLFPILVGVVFLIVVAVSIHWSLLLVYFVGILILTFLVGALSKKIKAIQSKIVKETAALAGSTTESLRNIELIKSLGLTQQEVKRLNTNTYKILGLELSKVKRVRSIAFLQGTTVHFIRIIILSILTYIVFAGRLTTGQLISMQFYSFFIFGPLQELGSIITSYREAETSINNFDNLMKKPVDHKPDAPLEVGDIAELSFENVSFQHTTAQYKALENITFSVEKGETIAFVGPSGAGKSTLVKLLVGLYRPVEGDIFYNGKHGNEIDFDELRGQIGFVTQDTQLFSGTIKENLLFAAPGATEEDLWDALHKASCENLLQRAEHGLDTMIGEGGLKLSGGEKQRLSIARALIRRPRLLIFDEATSALDSLTEEAITNTIRVISEEKNQVTVMIAHRLSTIMHADRIYVLEKGQIVEMGSHAELLVEKGLYYAMWRQQIGERKAIMA